ncbi:Transcriptional regulatory protein [Mortierella antarctica]|nr:Transcriptional regulatory protein [Mortierella antarctica]
MPELASLPEKQHKDQLSHTASTDMKANNNKDKAASGTMDPSSTNSSVTTIATQAPPLDKTPLKTGEEEAEEGEVMEDIEEGELEEDDKTGVLSQDQSQSQSQSRIQPQTQIQNSQQKEEVDQDMKEASPEPAMEDEEASSAMSTDKPEQQSHIGEEINEDDLNGGLLDGALDDYDDLDQDTEDTEVGNGDHDFSDDDDDDDDDLLDQQLMSDKLDADDVEMHTPNGAALADTKSEERDTDAQGEDEDEDEAGSTNEKDAPVHSEDSDSDLPDPDPSDLEDGEVNEDAQDDEDEEDEEDEEEGNADEEDEDAEDEDEAQKKAPTPKKDVVFPQKPTLNRSQATEEELKDSGDELSDLSEFDDTDDSDEDEDDRVPGPKSGGKDSAPSAPSGATSSTPSKSGGSGSSSGTGKTGPGRKKSVQENADDKQDAPKSKSTAPSTIDQKAEHPVEVPNGRARLIEPAGRNRSVSNAETNQSDKDSGSEAAEENEEEEEEAPEETPAAGEQEEEEEEGDGGDEEGDDLETKQIHKEALEALTSIEVEFASLRDKMYEERMMELDKEVEMINNGTHPELSSLMQEIAQKREQRLQIADAGKRYKSDIAQSQFEVAEYLAHCTFQSARRNARGDMARELGSKQRKMILELTLTADTQKRKVLAEKSTLIRARKQRRMEVAELKGISERHAFPASSKLAMVSNIELEDDFSAMGLARLLPQPAPPSQPVPQYVPVEQEMYGHRPHAPSASGPVGYGPSIPHPSRAPPVHSTHNNRWPEPDYPPLHQSMAPPSGRYYDSRPEVEIYVDGSRCSIDGMWYKPQDSVVVLDAAIGKYKAKYLFLANDEIVLQRTDGSKTKLHLGLFRGRKLYMQPQ